MKSPIALLRSLFDDLNRLNPGVKGLDRDLETIELRFENEGYGFLTVALLALDEAVLHGLSTGKFTCPKQFKTLRGGAIPRFTSGMLCEIFEPSSGILKETIDDGVLKGLRNLLRIFKKVQLPEIEVDKLHSQAVSEFFRCDRVAGHHIIDGQVLHSLQKVACYVLWPLSSRRPDVGTYKHGPGAVFETLSVNQKWLALSNSIKNAEFDIETYGYDNHEVSLSVLSERIMTTESLSQPGFNRRILSSTARLISVPKNSSSRRTITVEPMLNQFRQQGLNTILRDSISEDRVLSKCLSLTDQSLNQKLALEGSLTDNWATIDLKSASDLLSVKLVETVFGYQREFLSLMMDCRSTQVECDQEDTTNLCKFAGMGNALTFPVQSVCFAVICIASILNQQAKAPDYRNVVRAAQRIRVYGDDIIVDTKYVHQCVNWLERAGLKVNTSKSFLEGNFKESCGVEAFRGVDITPLYIKHRPETIETSPELIAGFVSLSNQCWMQGLYKTSDYLKENVEARLRRRLPLVSSRSGALGWHSRQDAMNPCKWDRRTQQFLTRSVVLVPLKRKDRLDGYPALLKFFHVPLLGRDKDHLSKTAIRYKNRLVSRWVATQVFA
ncbi:TPA_asm: RNA-directed RNA polymerase [ssRNA phage Esthiorhiza.3_12]|uniref:RNA-directed RNA polymerase n=2 Tax=Leviviricetes TaxID=2842243 RepID=A0A8S5L2J0_9VIRU|nr:RNA-directed RNA polymerase [ssRNA phage Esthiorhiza.3_12]QDH88111.1 MAG: RNA-dependent RNA polymerase [Leviviridae sp.]DAD52038.1 TPA_asm: RNA-directed RNA polymerase [ssRNA phage Esthiorhiza.3_12]